MKAWYGRLSPTAIEAFDPKSVFGCERKWWYQYRSDLPKEPPNAAMLIGTAMHDTIEAYLKGAPVGVLHEVVRPGTGIIDEVKTRLVSVEGKISTTIAGVPVDGRVDVLAMKGGRLDVVDWKTTSNIKKWAKTLEEVRTATQMVIYDKWAMETFDVPVEHGIVNTQVFFQTKGKVAPLPLSAVLSKPEFDSRINEISEIVEQIKIAALVDDPEKVVGRRSKCDIGFGCPYRAVCSVANEPPKLGEDEMADLMDMFGFDTEKTEPAAVVPPPVPTAPAAPRIQEPAQVLPPDAPKSTPALASKPVEGFSPPPRRDTAVTQEIPVVQAPAPTPQVAHRDVVASETPPKRGRPPGSKNAPKEELAPGIVNPDVVKPKATAAVRITSVTVRHGATVNMGNFQSAKVDVEMTGLVEEGATVEAARAAVALAVRTAMNEELKVYAKAPAADAKAVTK